VRDSHKHRYLERPHKHLYPNGTPVLIDSRVGTRPKSAIFTPGEKKDHNRRRSVELPFGRRLKVVVFSADPESSRVAGDSDQIGRKDSDGASATSTTPIALPDTTRIARPSPGGGLSLPRTEGPVGRTAPGSPGSGETAGKRKACFPKRSCSPGQAATRPYPRDRSASNQTHSARTSSWDLPETSKPVL